LLKGFPFYPFVMSYDLSSSAQSYYSPDFMIIIELTCQKVEARDDYPLITPFIE
jgi:hypothetical protein